MLLIQQHGELCVCELTAALALSQPKVSRHLAQLRQCGLLADRRQGQWVFYQLPAVQPDWVRAVLEAILDGQGSLIEVARQRLAAMNNRPNRCC
ncbi:metalloregulator ArsR/SmtB family transcription factor [Natronospirillum operosum]